MVVKSDMATANDGPVTHVELVTQELREMIVNGKLPANSRVRERELAEQLGVSRTPVRVALGILETDGLVVGHPNRGFTVAEFTVEDVLSAYDVRGVLEGFAVRTAIEGGALSGQSLRMLEACVSDCEDMFAAPTTAAEMLPRFAVANETFHNTIIAAADRSALTKTCAQLARMPLVSPTNYLFSREREEEGVEGMVLAHAEHRPILDAIRRGQGARGEALMREHIYLARERLKVLLTSDQSRL